MKERLKLFSRAKFYVIFNFIKKIFMKFLREFKSKSYTNKDMEMDEKDIIYY